MGDAAENICLACRDVVCCLGSPPVCLRLKPGEFVGLRELPPQPESQLLSIAGLLSAPVSGQVTVMGSEADYERHQGLLNLRYRVGYVGPGSALISNLTLFDNIAFGHRYHGVFSEEELAVRVRAQVTLLGLGEALYLKPAAMSFEVRRLGVFARELAKEPCVVILDHPSLGLGEEALDRVLHSLQVRKRQGMSALMTCEPAFEPLCDRVLVIERGKEARECEPRRSPASETA